MRIVVKTRDLTREQWLRYRTMGIGGSDVSVIAGINPFKSVHQLWLEKTGQTELMEEDNDYTHWGTILEPVVRKEFTDRTGIKVRQKHMLLQSEDHPFMLADLDGVINENGKLCIFEAKTASAYKEDQWEDGVPSEYILQVQHYMAVTGAGKTYIAALVGGNHFYCHEIPRDEELIGKIISMEEYFWSVNVKGKVEPVPDGSEATTKYFNSRFSESSGATIQLPEEALAVCEEYDRLSEQLKEIETEKDAAANQLKLYLKDAETGIAGNRTVTWKPFNRTSIDVKRLKAEQPEIFDNYTKQRQFRRLSVA